MKILLAADVHVEHSFIDGGNNSERESALVLDVITNIIEKEKPNHFVIIGDFFDAFGKVTASLAVNVKKYVFKWANLGTKVHFLAGNHDYEKVEQKFFGKSIVSALFGNMEEFGITVTDEIPRKISLNNTNSDNFDIFLLAIPYRETLEQWTDTCQSAISRFYEESKNSRTLMIPCWHVGLPFGNEAWRGDESENGWIRSGNKDVDRLLAQSFNGKVYCGHYHGPGFTECKIEDENILNDIKLSRPEKYISVRNGFTYIGSPATRSRSEHNQNKRLMLLNVDESTGSCIEREISTRLNLDYVADSIENAKKHMNYLTKLFGEKVLDIARVSILLSEDASLDDYHIVREMASKIRGNIFVEKPRIHKKGKVEEIRDKFISDPAYGRQQMELDIARLALLDFYKIPIKDKLTVRLLSKVGYETFSRLLKDDNKAKSLDLVKDKIRLIYLKSIESDLINRVMDKDTSKIIAYLGDKIELITYELEKNDIYFDNSVFEKEVCEEEFVKNEVNKLTENNKFSEFIETRLKKLDFVDISALLEFNNKEIENICRYVKTRILLEKIGSFS